MTDTTASSASPQSYGDDRLSGPADVSGETSARGGGEGNRGGEWNTVAFPGQLSLTDNPIVAASETSGPATGMAAPLDEALDEASLDETSKAASPAETGTAPSPEPENVIQLIQDLNQCNDALLLRVSELEEALERSQVALQAEIERHQAAPGGLPLTAVPGPVQHQIAQLLSELEIANDGLRRTTIHNETLHAELDVNQQRVAQLERECTLLQQRFSEKSTALHQAEETCRDLKARLHRQQRYTLQFKAALEKCLNMAAGPAAVESSPAIAPGQLTLGAPQMSAAADPSQPIGLPRSQQIQPWSAGGEAPANSPDLTQLLRGLQRASSGTGRGGGAPASHPAIEPVQAPRFAPEIAPAATQPDPMPSFPEALPTVITPPEVALAPADPWLEEEVAEPPDATPSVFTEPSPWGEPIAPPVMTAPVPAPTDVAPPAMPAAAPAVSATAPAPLPMPVPAYLTAGAQVSPSPLVYPLRSQKKIKSIAAVELPNFGRNSRRR